MINSGANKRPWAPYTEGPMRVSAEILDQCAKRIEPAWKARLRAMLLPLIKRKYRLGEVGKGVHWGANSHVAGALFGHYSSFGHSAEFHGPVVVGDLTMLSTHVQVIGQDHGIADLETPMRLDFPATARPVTTIEADCWIGSRVTIMEGVRIGRGSVVGARSVVTRDIPPYAIAIGSPARVLRQRISESDRISYDQRLYGKDMGEGRDHDA